MEPQGQRGRGQGWSCSGLYKQGQSHRAWQSPLEVAQWGRVAVARLGRWRCHTGRGVQLFRCALEGPWGVLEKRSHCWIKAALALGKRGQFDLHVSPATVNKPATQAICPYLQPLPPCPSTTQRLFHTCPQSYNPPTHNLTYPATHPTSLHPYTLTPRALHPYT